MAAGEERERKQAYGKVLSELERRLRIFTNLPIESLDRISLQSKVSEIRQGQLRSGRGMRLANATRL